MMNLDSILQFFRNPGTDAGQLEAWREKILLIILRVSAVGGFVIYLVNILREQQNNNWVLIGIYTVAFLWTTLIAIFNTLPYRFRAISFSVILFGIGVLSSLTEMYAGANQVWLTAFVLFSAILVGVRAGFLSLLVSTAALFSLGYGFQMGWITSRKIGAVIAPDDFSIWASTGITFFVIQAALVSTMSFIIYNLAHNLHQATRLSEELQDGKETLEDQAADLLLRNQYLEASKKITRTLSTILNSDELFRMSVKMLQDQFQLHHVDIFHFEPEVNTTTLKACSGDHRSDLVVIEGRDNLVEKSLRSREVQTLQNINVADMPIGNIKLVTTRSAASIPMLSRGKLLGAVVIQQDSPEGFPGRLLTILKTAVDQIAAALDNAFLYQEARLSVTPEPQAPGEWSQEAWRKALQRRQSVGYYFDGRNILPVQNKPPEAERIGSTGDQEVVTIPIRLYGQTIGHVEAVKPSSDEAWTDTELDLLNTITERLEVAIDSARLYEETQKRAEGERIVGEVTSRLRETLDIDTVLRTAAAEMRSVFDLEEVEVRLTSPGSQNSTMEDENGS